MNRDTDGQWERIGYLERWRPGPPRWGGWVYLMAWMVVLGVIAGSVVRRVWF